MPKPRIILALGDAGRPANAVVLDHRSNTIWFDGDSRKFLPQPFRVVASIIACQKPVLEKSELYDLIWGDDADGGPENPSNYVDRTIRLTSPRKLASGRSVSLADWLGIWLTTDRRRRFIIDWNHENTA